MECDVGLNTVFHMALTVALKSGRWSEALDQLEQSGLFSGCGEAERLDFESALAEYVAADETRGFLFDESCVDGPLKDFDLMDLWHPFLKVMDWSMEGAEGEDKKAVKLVQDEYEFPEHMILKWYEAGVV